jgi:hypothetical protein
VRPTLVVGDNETIIIPDRSYPGFTTGWLENRLSSLAIEFIGLKEMDIAARLLVKAEEAGGAKLLDRHFAYQGMAQAYYRHRNEYPEALNLVIDACENRSTWGRKPQKCSWQKTLKIISQRTTDSNSWPSSGREKRTTPKPSGCAEKRWPRYGVENGRNVSLDVRTG